METNRRYVHYWHFNKNWYAVVTDNPKPDRIYGHSESDDGIYNYWEKYFIEDSTFKTEREIKVLLSKRYPDAALVKDRPYHEGRRWFVNKKGSRR